MDDVSSRLASALAERYRVERELGQGGMATVYLAHDLRHDRDVAIKVLHPDLGAALGAERFLSEIKTTARLQHPHILPLLDSGSAGELLFYVMPYVTGETLRDRLAREKQLPIDEAVQLAREVADALAYAHGLGVIHRDIKPENILLQGGHALVADFGIALAVQQAGGARMTQTGLSLGTPQYMSPEQAMGERTIDARSDVYALGAVTYEMLVGEPPFTGATVQAIVARVLSSAPESPTRVRSTVPAGVERAVLTALAKLPADRFASARAFADALARPGDVPAPLSAASTPAIAIRTPRGAIAGMGALALVALVALGGWWRASQRETGTAPVRFAVELPAESQLELDQASFDLSPDGRTIAFSAATRDGRRALYLRRLDAIAPVRLDSTEGAVQPFFSPDGAWIGFFAGPQMKKVRVGGGAVVTLAEVNDPAGASWGTAGLIFVASSGRLAVVPEGGGKVQVLEGGDTPEGASERYPIALPDGKSALYTVWRGGIKGARVMHRTIAAAPGQPVGIDDAVAIGIVGRWIVVGGQGGVLMVAPIDAGATRVTAAPAHVFEGVARISQKPTAAVASNGTLLYLSGSALADLVLVGPRGEAAVISRQPREYSDPRYAPGGARIATAVIGREGSDLWIIDPAARTETRLTTDGQANQRPEWTPDGSRVLYRSQRDSMRAYWSQRWDGGSAAERLYSVAQKDIWEASISPDGAWLLYRLGTSGTADIWYRRLAGDTASHPFVATPATEVEARFSPDGKWIAYTSFESGTPQVYVRPFPTGDARFQLSTDGGEQAIWSPDGRSIYYTALRGGVIMRARVVTVPSFVVARRDTAARGNFYTPRNGHATYDVAPDGEHLLVVRRLPSANAAVVVIGWFDEVRAKLAAEARR